MPALRISDELKRFLGQVAKRLDSDPAVAADGDEAFVGACAHGGRVPGEDDLEFTYYPSDGGTRRRFRLAVDELTAVAEGIITEVDTLPLAKGRPKRSAASGDPLLVWGPSAEDSWWVRRTDELGRVLDAIQAEARKTGPHAFHLWSPRDDLLVGAVNGDDATLQVVQSHGKYLTTKGNPEQTERFEATDPEGRLVRIPWADTIPWRTARLSCLRFASEGEVSADLPVVEKIRADVVIHARGGRKAAVEQRGEPPRDPAWTSLRAGLPTSGGAPAGGRKTGTGLAERLLMLLVERQLIELMARVNRHELIEELEALLDEQGEESLDSLEAAEELADSLADLPGVEDLFGTAVEVQQALADAIEA